MTAAITWAVLATVGAVAVYWLMRREVRYWTHRSTIHWVECGTWQTKAQAAGLELSLYKAAERARLSAHMREIGIRGNKSPKRKAAIQRLQVVGKAAEINREMGR